MREYLPVRRLGQEDIASVVDVLCEAFSDYPVMRFVVGDSEDYAEDLRELVSFFVAARAHRDEVLLGVEDGDGLTAAALVSYPDGRETPAAVGEIRERLWKRLGPAARSRYEGFGAATAPFEVNVPHIHLNMIGVRARSRGGGLGRVLLDAVHELSRLDPRSTGVTLSTEVPDNVPLYEHFGYEVVGSADVQGAFTSWGMFRPDPTDPPNGAA